MSDYFFLIFSKCLQSTQTNLKQKNLETTNAQQNKLRITYKIMAISRKYVCLRSVSHFKSRVLTFISVQFPSTVKAAPETFHLSPASYALQLSMNKMPYNIITKQLNHLRVEKVQFLCCLICQNLWWNTI